VRISLNNAIILKGNGKGRLKPIKFSIKGDKIMKIFCFILVSFFISNVYAQRVGTISEGMWFNPDASGRGVTIEIQNGVIVATYFGYKNNGDSIWWQGVATETATNQFDGDFIALQNGQCVGCNYTQPELNEFDSIGAFSFRFLNSNELLLNWAGASEHLIKYDFGYANVLDYAYGLWIVSGFFNDLTSIGEEVIMFYDESTNSSGNRFLIGNRSGYQNTSQYLAVAMTYDDGLDGRNAVSILLDSSTSYYRFYIANITENGLEGRYWLYRKDEQPTGSGLLTKGHKHWDNYELSARLGNFKSQIESKGYKVFEQIDDEQYHLMQAGEINESEKQFIVKSFIDARIALEKIKSKQ